MTLAELLLGGGGIIGGLLTVIQLSPIKWNPWSAILKWVGRSINSEVLSEVADTKKRLQEHVETDDSRRADDTRARILAFNRELMRGERHTREEFWDVLAAIDRYHDYCEKHPNYPNERAVHAIRNIGRVYDERQQKNDFLPDR